MIKIRKLEEKDIKFMLEWMHDYETLSIFQNDFLSVDENTAKQFINNSFSNVSQITLSTGIQNTNFIVCIPNNRSITSVIDSSNLNADITLNYILINNNFQVEDVGGVNHAYKLYAMTTAIPYFPSANHIITIN